MSFDFTGKRAVICGGSRGIGRAIALGFAQAGGAVSICARGADTLHDGELVRFVNDGYLIHMFAFAQAKSLADAQKAEQLLLSDDTKGAEKKYGTGATGGPARHVHRREEQVQLGGDRRQCLDARRQRVVQAGQQLLHFDDGLGSSRAGRRELEPCACRPIGWPLPPNAPWNTRRCQ